MKKYLYLVIRDEEIFETHAIFSFGLISIKHSIFMPFSIVHYEKIVGGVILTPIF